MYGKRGCSKRGTDTGDEGDKRGEEGEVDEGGDDKSYFVIKFKAVEITKEVKRSDGW